MTRIDWARRSGEEIETVVGILLCRRHPTAERITPSQGDAGLDVIIRESDGWIVYQVKKYTAQPTSSQKGKIRKSLTTLIESRDDETVIKAWHLVAPVSPTPPSLRWFVNLTEPAPFSCTWSGSDFLDGLASEFPDVIDYYFRDGKDRLAVAVTDLARALSPSAAGIVAAPGENTEIAPTLAIDPVLAAHALMNRLDPHFRYDFSVDSQPPDLSSSGGFVFAETRGSGSQYFTFRVYEKYRAALADRPITLNAIFRTPEGSQQNAMKDFIDYGAPFELPRDLATIEADLPGGLAGTLTGAVRIIPWSSFAGCQARPIRMRIVDAAAGAQYEVRLHMQPATSGVDRRNLRGVADEDGGAFSVECRFTDEDSSQSFQFSPHELSGKVASRVVAGLRFLANIRTGNGLQLAQEYGPYVGEPLTIPRDLTALVDARVLELVESIAVLQTLTQDQLVVPNLSELTLHQGEEIVVAAKILTGEEVPVYFGELEFTPNGSPVPQGENAMYIVRDFDLDIVGVPVAVGPVGFHFERVRVDLEQDVDCPRGVIRVRPVDSPKIKAIARLLPDEVD